MDGDKGISLAKWFLALTLLIVWGISILFPHPPLEFLASSTSQQAFCGAIVGLTIGSLLVLRRRLQTNRPRSVGIDRMEGGRGCINLLFYLAVTALGVVITCFVIRWSFGAHCGIVPAEVATVFTLLLAGWQLYPPRRGLPLFPSHLPPLGPDTPLSPPRTCQKRASGGRPPKEPPESA